MCAVCAVLPLPRPLKRENQDCFFAVPDVTGAAPHLTLLGVADGHGNYGRLVAQWVKEALPAADFTERNTPRKKIIKN